MATKTTSQKPAALTTTPKGYGAWLASLKTRIHSAQQRAALAVNRELVLLYWQIGRDILTKQAEQGWGAKVITRLAHDLRTAFPEMKGFSRANLLYMRAFAQAWPNAEIVQQAVGQLPLGHNLVLLARLKQSKQRLPCVQSDTPQHPADRTGHLPAPTETAARMQAWALKRTPENQCSFQRNTSKSAPSNE